MPIQLLRNRLLISQIKRDSRKLKRQPLTAMEKEQRSASAALSKNSFHDESENAEPDSSRNIWGKFKSKSFVILLISQSPICVVDEEQAKKDYQLMQPEYLRNSLIFNHIYFYLYEKEGDISQVVKKVDVA